MCSLTGCLFALTAACAVPDYKPIESGGGAAGSAAGGNGGAGPAASAGAAGGGVAQGSSTSGLSSSLVFGGWTRPGAKEASELQSLSLTPTAYLAVAAVSATQSGVLEIGRVEPSLPASPAALDFSSGSPIQAASTSDGVLFLAGPHGIWTRSAEGASVPFSASPVGALAVNDDVVAWADDQLDAIRVKPVTGGTEVEIFQDPAFRPELLAASTDRLYMTGFDLEHGGREVRVISLPDGAQSSRLTLPSEQLAFGGSVLADDSLMLFARRSTAGGLQDVLVTLPLDGTSATITEADFGVPGIHAGPPPRHLCFDGSLRAIVYPAGPQIRRLSLP